MADVKISELPELAETPAADDLIPIVNTDGVVTDYVQHSNLIQIAGTSFPTGSDGKLFYHTTYKTLFQYETVNAF